MPEENQIDGIYRVILTLDECEKHDDIKCIKDCRKCLAIHIHNAGYRRQREARWIFHPDGSGTCTECGTNQKNVWDFDNYQNYCGHCGAIMKGCE